MSVMPPAVQGRRGICLRGLGPKGGTLATGIAATVAAGYDALLVGSIFDLSAGLDAAELGAARDQAAAAGVGLVVGLPYLHPHRIETDADFLAAGSGDGWLGLQRSLEAATQFVGHDIPFVLGYVEDRLSSSVPWRRQLADAAAVFRRLAPQLRDLGLRLCIKTHEEITTFEILRLIDDVGADVLSVGFDPVNVLLRLENPLEAARRIAPYVTQVYVDNARFSVEGESFRRWLSPHEDAVLDWPALVGILAPQAPTARYWIDLHRGQFSVNPYADDAFEVQPDLTEREQLEVVRLVQASAAVIDAALVDDLRSSQADGTGRLAQAIAALDGLALGT